MSVTDNEDIDTNNTNGIYIITNKSDKYYIKKR